MENSRSWISRATALAGCLALGACTLGVGDINFNIKDAKVSLGTAANLESVKAGENVPVTVTASNVYLVEPTATPPTDQAANAGHIRIYLDDVATPPLVITAQVNVSVTIPGAIREGKHKFICRIHKHDGTATSAIFEMTFNITATVGVPVDMEASPAG